VADKGSLKTWKNKVETGKCLLCLGKEDVKHIWLTCQDIRKLRLKF
jgi:hypothetical protein